jgi:hypothetical protein
MRRPMALTVLQVGFTRWAIAFTVSSPRFMRCADG